MAAGAAVVATATDGAREITGEGETGILVPIGSSEEIAKAIASLLTDDAGRRELAARGEARVKQVFSLDRMVDETERLYKSL